MLKIAFAAAFALALPSAAFAACSMEDAMGKSSDLSEILMAKVQSKPDEASKIMSDMGEAMGTGTVTAATCTKLDALMVRARKL